MEKLESLTREDIGQRLTIHPNVMGVVNVIGSQITVRFYWSYETKKKTRNLYIAQWPKKSIKSIFSEISETRKIIKKGLDPSIVKKVSRIKRQNEIDAMTDALMKAKTSRLTVADLYQDWIVNGVSRENHNAELKRSFHKDVLPLIGNIQVRHLSDRDLMKVFYEQRQRGVTRLVLVTYSDIRQMMSWAYKRQPWLELMRNGNPAELVDKRMLVPKQYTEERERVLSINEIHELGHILHRMEVGFSEAADKRRATRPVNKKTQLAIWICLGAICRIGELVQTQWENVDLRSGIWFIPREITKGHRQHHVIFMSEFVREQFIQLHAITGHSKWCFPARNVLRASGHMCLKTITKQIRDRQSMFRVRTAQLSARANNNSLVLGDGLRGEWTPHDLRRTGATLMQSLGISLEVIDRCQNHVLSGSKVRRHYLHHDYATETAHAWKVLGDEIAGILAGDIVENEHEFMGMQHPLHQPQWLNWNETDMIPT